ncbi:hypothetical protein P9112_007500 [Eukaryota sp. TZLM1-RC]
MADNDDFEYTDVDVTSFNVDNSDEDEDLDTMIGSLSFKLQEQDLPQQQFAPTTNPRPAVVIDYFRNFLVHHNLSKTYETFENEWLSHSASLQPTLTEDDAQIALDMLEPPTDVYLENQQLHNRIKSLERQVTQMSQVADTAKSSFEKFKKQRDFHKMHHRRVVQEKERLLTDLRRLKTHYESYPEALATLKDKYETLMKQKSLLKIENDRLKSKISNIEDNQEEPKPKEKKPTTTTSLLEKTLSCFPSEHPEGPHPHGEPPLLSSQISIDTSHGAPVSGIDVHPIQNTVVATCSDDCSWRLWDISNGNFELILTATGHSSWISDISFHPEGEHVATVSGDGSARFWSLANGSSQQVHSATELQGFWSLDFHYTGNFLVVGSIDHTAKIFDVGSCSFSNILNLRGHVDSVNSVDWYPFSNVVATGSADKTVSLWDCRANQCLQSLFGHSNAVRSVKFSVCGSNLFSSDSDGNSFVWDCRNFGSPSIINTGNHGVNCTLAHSSNSLAVSCSDDGTIKGFDCKDGSWSTDPIFTLTGHDDMVQQAVFVDKENLLVSIGSDCSIRLWK